MRKLKSLLLALGMLLPFLLIGASPLPGAAASGPDSARATTTLRPRPLMFSENVGRCDPSTVIRCDQTTPLGLGADVRCPAPPRVQPRADEAKPSAPVMTAPDSHIGAPDVSASPFITSYTFYEKTSALGSPLDAQSTTGPVPPPGIDVAGVSAVSQAAVTIPDVPAYLWHHGCGPTAAGMVIGYWDAHGFDALVGGDADMQTAAVNAMIASEGPASNYTDYCLPLDYHPDLLPDKSEPPLGDEHPDDCVADYMKTSQSHYNNYYGWSWFSDVGPSVENYVSSLGRADYYVTVSNLYMHGGLNWDSFRVEIDSARPVVLLVDADGNGSTDHFVTAVGYDAVDDARKYACLHTWDPDIHWYDFAAIASGQLWGIFGAITFGIFASPTNVTITGPTTSVVGVGSTFTATVSPMTATLPITYMWQATAQTPVTHTGGVSDTIAFSWGTTGTQTITIRATNAGGTVTDTHGITVVQVQTPPRACFLPVVCAVRANRNP